MSTFVKHNPMFHSHHGWAIDSPENVAKGKLKVGSPIRDPIHRMGCPNNPTMNSSLLLIPVIGTHVLIHLPRSESSILLGNISWNSNHNRCTVYLQMNFVRNRSTIRFISCLGCVSIAGVPSFSVSNSYWCNMLGLQNVCSVINE